MAKAMETVVFRDRCRGNQLMRTAWRLSASVLVQVPRADMGRPRAEMIVSPLNVVTLARSCWRANAVGLRRVGSLAAVAERPLKPVRTGGDPRLAGV
jgi:hypothetical protein